MRVTCEVCHQSYDDAQRLTYCPHDMLMSMADLARKDLAISLMGKSIRLRHEPASKATKVVEINWQGMIIVDGVRGLFDPTMFVVMDGEQTEWVAEPAGDPK